MKKKRYKFGPLQLQVGHIIIVNEVWWKVTRRPTDFPFWVAGHKRYLRKARWHERAWVNAKDWVFWAWEDYKESWIIRRG